MSIFWGFLQILTLGASSFLAYDGRTTLAIWTLLLAMFWQRERIEASYGEDEGYLPGPE